MNKPFFLISTLVLSITTTSFAQQEQITITTYYPSPVGVYRELAIVNSNYNNGWGQWQRLGTPPDAGFGFGHVGRRYGYVTQWDSDYAFFGLADVDGVAGGDDKDVIIGWEQSSDDLRFQVGNNDLVTIKGGGGVGIGTTDPKQRLQVMGNMVLAGSCIGDDGHIIHHNGTGNMYVGRTSGGNCGWPAGWAYLSPGGVWTDQSSRASKDNIRDLSEDEAIAAVMKLQPVKFNYKNHNGEEYVGFIAEDVPDLVASEDRKGLSPMDIVAVLTKVVQQQQKEIKGLKAQLNERAAKTGSELF